MIKAMVLFVIAVVAFSVNAHSGEEIAAQQLVEVYRDEAIAAAPYYEMLGLKTDTRLAKLSEFSKSVVHLANLKEQEYRLLNDGEQRYLPIKSEYMKVGRPTQIIINSIYQPIFIIGMDDTSLNWLASNINALGDLKAQGVVVQATSWARWLALKAAAEAEGVSLVLAPIDELARHYGIVSYPLLIVSNQEGKR